MLSCFAGVFFKIAPSHTRSDESHTRTTEIRKWARAFLSWLTALNQADLAIIADCHLHSPRRGCPRVVTSGLRTELKSGRGSDDGGCTVRDVVALPYLYQSIPSSISCCSLFFCRIAWCGCRVVLPMPVPRMLMTLRQAHRHVHGPASLTWSSEAALPLVCLRDLSTFHLAALYDLADDSLMASLNSDTHSITMSTDSVEVDGKLETPMEDIDKVRYHVSFGWSPLM